MSERLHRPWPALLTALVLVASGCGGGHDGEATTAINEASTTTTMALATTTTTTTTTTLAPTTTTTTTTTLATTATPTTIQAVTTTTFLPTTTTTQEGATDTVGSPPTPLALSKGEQLRVVVTGDSVIEQVLPHLAKAFGSAAVIERRVHGGTALCDWFAEQGGDLGIEHLADWQPHVIVVAHGGNAMTPCMAGPDGEPLEGQAFFEKYLADSEYVVELATQMDSRVLFVNHPVWFDGSTWGTDGIFRSMPDRYPGGFVRFASTWPTLSPDGQFLESAPCWEDEPGCVDGYGELRSGLWKNHLQTLAAWRYALAIVEEFVAAGWVDLKVFAMEPEVGDG